jgi:glycerate-2-kinase
MRACLRLGDGKDANRISPGRTILLLAGGVDGDGRWEGKRGRCQEFALAAAISWTAWKDGGPLRDHGRGIDGVTDAAGGFACGNSCARARTWESPRAHLDDNSYAVLSALNASFKPVDRDERGGHRRRVIAPGRRGQR